ncbi:MAG: hypothetical protein ACLQVN_00190 [Bryobacteraceae bacterium]
MSTNDETKQVIGDHRGAAIPGCRAEIRLGLPRHLEKPKTCTKMHNAIPPPHTDKETKEVIGVHRRLKFVFSSFLWLAPSPNAPPRRSCVMLRV